MKAVSLSDRYRIEDRNTDDYEDRADDYIGQESHPRLLSFLRAAGNVFAIILLARLVELLPSEIERREVEGAKAIH